MHKFERCHYFLTIFILVFFLGKGPFPGIVDLYTFGGRLSEPRASLLANKGFVVLALAYCAFQDLPKNPKNLDLEYFEEAVTYLRRHPEVNCKSCIRDVDSFVQYT